MILGRWHLRLWLQRVKQQYLFALLSRAEAASVRWPLTLALAHSRLRIDLRGLAFRERLHVFRVINDSFPTNPVFVQPLGRKLVVLDLDWVNKGTNLTLQHSPQSVEWPPEQLLHDTTSSKRAEEDGAREEQKEQEESKAAANRKWTREATSGQQKRGKGNL
jgi:hypothetical protein